MQDEFKESNIFNSENDNISDIIQMPEHNEAISEKLIDTFSIRLSQLEQSYKEKDSDISNLMFKLHSIILSGVDIKTQLPPVKLFGSKNITPNDKQDPLNSSKMSTMSRRSVSSSKATMTRQFGKNLDTKEKIAKFTQKAAINICASQSQDSNLNRSNIHRSPMRENVNNQQKSQTSQNKFIIKSKNVKVSESTNNKSGVKKNDEKQTKLNGSNNNLKSPLVHTNIVDAKKGKETISNDKTKQFKRKTNSDDFSNSNNNSKGNITNNQLIKNPTSVNHIGKNHTGNYHSSGIISSSEIFTNQNNTKISTYKLEPKKKNIVVIDKEPKFKKLFNHKNCQKILFLICKFSNFNEQFIFKNFSKSIRKMYFHNLITELSQKLKQVNNKQEVQLELEIPKILEMKINKENIVLSKFKDTYRNIQSFNNIINILYILVQETDKIDWSKTIDEKIAVIEEFSSKYDSNNNIYKGLKEITLKIKSSNQVYESLKKNSIYTKFTFTGLSVEFTPLAEFLNILNKSFINKSNNMELLIDIEIIDHKIDILKTLADNF